ncbi:hypothetical protein LZK73_18375 [Neorhizobium galegae]|nr:hypothetical protein LZK73_18375 [Neorhizobium galegae]
MGRRRWLVYSLTDTSFLATGAISYSLGAGGDINVPRTNSVEAAYFRQVVGAPGDMVDYPLTILNAREDYNNIALKGMASFPSVLFYDSGWPMGNVFIWPVPSSIYEIHLSLKTAFSAFSNLNAEVSFPPEYEEAMRLNLAVRLRVSYRMPSDPQLNALAKIATNTVKNSNTQIPLLNFPSDLPRNVGGRYNIFSDRNG